MNNVLKTTLLLIATTLAFVACRKKAFDDYYGRPASLEPPIYQTLQAKGRFNNLLSVIDKSGYKATLSGAGYWTFFAPNDSAFQVYFRENNIGGVAQLDSAACQKIVTYCLVYYAFNKDRVDDYQSNIGWQVNTAFKRRTANYTGVYNDTNFAGAKVQAIASNRNNNGTVSYVDADQNNKYIPIFTDTFFRSSVISTSDYNYFYPNITFSGFNVANAQVLEKNIPAENGVVHEINRVIVALPSIDQYLSSRKDQYSLFKSLLDQYLVQYVLNTTVTQNWNNRGFGGQVFTKVFNNNLAFSPNNENWLKTQDNDGQANTYTLFAPTNAVLQQYINNVLLENYPAGTTLDNIANRQQILYDLINAHMWLTPVWPSKFSSTFNYLNEPARFDPVSNIVDKKILSNGFFYGTNKVQEANVFTTVYGRVYLDSSYSIMQQLMGAEIRAIITNPSQKYTIFMMSNNAIRNAGYVQDPLLSADLNAQWRFTPPAGSTATAVTGAAAYQRLLRMLNMSVIPGEIVSLAGSGLAQSYGGEYIYWNANRVQASGNVESTVAANNWVNVSSSKTAINGRVYYCDKTLLFSETTIGKHIEKLATASPSIYGSFWNYLKNATYGNFFTTSTGDIQGISSGVFYTVLIPTNAAIAQAVADGKLPASTTPTSISDQTLVTNFISYHILNKRAEATDGIDRGAAETLLFTLAGPPATVFVKNSTSILQLGDMLTPANTYRAQTVPANSNFLSNRAVIHSITNYLRYVL